MKSSRQAVRLSRRAAIRTLSYGVGAGSVAFATACSGGTKNQPSSALAPGTATNAPPVGAARTSTPAAVTSGTGSPRGELVVLLGDLREQNFLPGSGSGTRQLYTEPLLEYPFLAKSDTAEIAPGLMTEATTSADGLTWTGKVRPGVKFHNGAALTSADFKFTVEFNGRDGTKSAQADPLKKIISSMDDSDPTQLRITFKTPQPDFSAAYFSLYGFDIQIISKAQLDAVGPAAAEKAPVGTGPYKFLSQQPDTITYEAVLNHWRVTPEFQRLTLRNVPEVATQLNLLQSGAADLVSVDFDTATQLASNTNLQKFTSPASYNAHLLFGNNYLPSDKRYKGPQPWSDIRVRQALNLAIDRDAIAKSIYHGFAKPARIGHLDALLPADVKPYPFDQEKAKALLKQAGADTNLTITMNSWVRDPGKELPQLVEIVAQYWSQVGVKTKIVPRDYTDFRKNWFAGTIAGEVFPLSLNTFYPSWAEELGKWYLPDLTIAVWESDAISQAAQKLSTTTDTKTRVDLETAVARDIYDNYGEIPLVVADSVFLGSKKLGTWKPPARWYPMYYEYATTNPPANTPKPFIV